MRRGRASGGLRRHSLPVPSLHSLGEGGSLLGACFSSWGLPLIGTTSPGPERRGSRPPRTIPTLFLWGVFSEIEAPGNSPHVGAGNSSDPATSPLGAPVSPPGQAPHPAPSPRERRSPSSAGSGEVASRTASDECPRPELPQSHSGAGGSGEQTHLAGAGLGGAGTPLPFSGSRQTFVGAQRASLGGPAKGARARRGEPGAAGGGGRPRARAAGARGSRRGMGPAASAGRAARPPAGPAALPAPSRLPLASAAARRAGARRAARNCFHCKQKKATHDQPGGGEARGGRGAQGRDGAEGAEGAGERENVGRAAGGLGRGAQTRWGGPYPQPLRSDRPCAPRPDAPGAQPGPRPDSPPAAPRGGGGGGGRGSRGGRARGRRGWWGRRRAACPFPGSGHAGGPALRRWQRVARNAPTPSACLTWLESKNKKNYDAGEACEGEKRFHFSPTTASWRDSQGRPQPCSSAHLVPREERHKGTAASRPGDCSSCRLQARVCRGRVAVTDHRAGGPS